jgi:hypothetical protein
VLLGNDGNCVGDIVVENATAVGAVIAPLVDNGGPTRTHALLPGSPAIDSSRATCPATDQRGVARPQDGNGDGAAVCDIGAYERAGTASGATPRPSSTPRPTSTPKPTSTSKPTSTPRPTSTPKPTSTSG